MYGFVFKFQKFLLAANDVFPREVVASIGSDANVVYRLNNVCPFKVYKGRALLDEFVVYNS